MTEQHDINTLARTLRSEDACLIGVWATSLQERGATASSVDRARRRLAGFARRLPSGLLNATREDVVAHFRDQGTAYLARYTELANGERPLPYLRHPSWAIFVSLAKSFYRWAERQGLVMPNGNPLRGIIEHPRISVGAPLEGAWYERLLWDPAMPYREAALMWLLGLGLGIAEICALSPTDVDLATKTVVVRTLRRRRVVPLTEHAVEKLRPWVVLQGGGRWLFPSPNPERRISVRTARNIVATVARRVFAESPELTKWVRPAGFRTLLIQRALASNLSPDRVTELTGLNAVTILRACRRRPPVARSLHEELNGIATRWPGWI